MQTLIENKKELPVGIECDVLVAGGGIAGIAAAIAAARTSRYLSDSARKSRVVLVERACLLGGLATLGLITIFLPLCDGMGKQVSFGLAEELLRLSIKHGAEGRYPDAWLDHTSFEERVAQRFEVQYNPHLFALEIEKWLLNEGVQILYHSQICGVAMTDGENRENGINGINGINEKNGINRNDRKNRNDRNDRKDRKDRKNDKISHIIIENKNGRSAIKANTVIDATGDADICKLAGEKTILFSQKNVLASWYYFTENGRVNLSLLGASDIPDNEKTLKRPALLTDRRFTGIDDISEMLFLSHEKMLEHILAHRKENASYLPVTLPTIPQARMTRRIAGINTLDDCDLNKSFSDSIGIISDWRKRGPIYEIPFTTLYGHGVKNLITAGRCISVTDAMWDISRAIPACAVTGEAAGTAAAMSDHFSMLDISLLQKELVRKNVKIK